MDFPDVLEITPITTNPQNGATTKGTPYRIRAYYEDATRMLNNENGTPIQCITFAMLPFGPSTVHIKKGDYVRRVSKSGCILTGEPYELTIRVSPIGGYSASHIELFTGSTGGVL